MIEKITTNVWYAVGALVFLTLLFHLLFVWIRNLPKKTWKKVDYVWISLAALGLIGATNSVQRIYASSEIELARTRIPWQFGYLMSFIKDSSLACRTSVKDIYTPPDFDQIVADDNRACEWRSKVVAVVSKTDTTNFLPINEALIPDLVTKENQFLKNVVTENIKKYNEMVSEYDANRKKADASANDVFIFFNPLLLIIGLAIRITKVSGELKYEK